jgi:hypothetical protein
MRAVLLLSSFFCLSIFRAAAIEPAPANDQALFLAGLPVRESPLTPLSLSNAWAEHATSFDAAWAKLQKRQLSPIGAWSAEFLGNIVRDRAPVFYPFSGPDFLYAHAFFPNADTYVLCGIEPVGGLPDVNRLPAEALAPALETLRQSLDDVLNFSFFITKKMRVDFTQTQLTGTLPVLYVFLARSGCHVDDVTLVGLDNTGQLVEGKSTTPGVRIRFTRPGAQTPQTLYYFSSDLSDGAASRGGFLKWCGTLGEGRAFLKAASYLMHGGNFNTIRSFLLSRCNSIVQDEAGLPIKAYDPNRWTLRLFGAYPGPIEIFKEHTQPQLMDLYRVSNAPRLSFGFGYRWQPSESTLIVASKKEGAPPSGNSAAPETSAPPQ